MITRIGRKNIYFIVYLSVMISLSGCRLFPILDNQEKGFKVDGYIEKGASTIVLNEETINELNLNNRLVEGSAEFTRVSSQLRNLNIGDVLVSGSNDKIPYGTLRKVTAKNYRNGGLYIETEEASLEEAIENAEVNASKQISINEIKDFVPLKSGVELENIDKMNTRGTWSPEPLKLSLKDTVLFDLDKNPSTTRDQIIANGELIIEPAFDYDLRIGFFRLKNFKFINRTKQKAVLNVRAGDIGDNTIVIDKKISLADINTGPIVFTIGGFPIVVNPIIKVFIGIDGEAIVDLNFDLEQNLQLKVGAEYNGDWRTVSDCLFKFNIINSGIHGSGRARIYASADMTLMFYGSVATRAGFFPFIEVKTNGDLSGDFLFEANSSNFKNFETNFDSSINSDLAWEVWAGFDVTAGVEAKILGKTLLKHNDVIYQQKRLLNSGVVSGDFGSGEPVCHEECWEENHGCHTETVCKTICN